MALKFHYKAVSLALAGSIALLAGAAWLCFHRTRLKCFENSSVGENIATNAVTELELEIQEVEALPVKEEDVCAASSDSPVRRKHRHDRRRARKSPKQFRQ
jgi:hypothetical protein